MKILSPEKIQQVDRLTIEREPIESIDLMERASMAFVNQFLEDFPEPGCVHIFCGPGNNGGDGLAIGRLLDGNEFHDIEVHVHILRFTDNFSADHMINSGRLLNTNVNVHYIAQDSDVPVEPLAGILVDAIFGSGLNKALRGLPASVVRFVNHPDHTIVSVDMPSGVFAEKPIDEPAVHADAVYTFQLPKLAFLLPENERYTGRWKRLDIGLDQTAIDEMETDHYFTTHEDAAAIFRERAKFSHKGSYGHALIMAGSKGKAGAAVLSAQAALRSGLGLLTMHIPSAILDIIQETVPEAMCSVDGGTDNSGDNEFLTICPNTEKYATVGIGPGIGQSDVTAACMKQLLSQVHAPMVIDADGLNILAADKELLEHVPPCSILTPHPGEFRRLAGPWSNDYEKLDLQKNLSAKYNVVVVLKGAHSCISDPSGHLYFNSTGNSGMATAGSGDSLTGIITGLLAQDYTSVEAAVLGVYIHGLAGDLALAKQHESSLIASDIIRHIGSAFKQIDKST